MNLNNQYLNLIKLILKEGELVKSRNSDVLQYFGPNNLVVENVSKAFPILQIRKLPFYKSVLETCFFLSGETSFESMPEVLRNSWWKPWAAEAKAKNSWGQFYSHQWRHQLTEPGYPEFDAFNHLIGECCDVIYDVVINRGMVVSLWNKPSFTEGYTSDKAVLQSCHGTAMTFNLVPDKTKPNAWHLDLHHYQRSLDVMCGTNADLVYSGLLMQIIADEVSNCLYDVNELESSPVVSPRKLVYSLGNAHIYASHMTGAYELLKTCKSESYEAYPQPTVTSNSPLDFKSIRSVTDAKLAFQLNNYIATPGNYCFELIG